MLPCAIGYWMTIQKQVRHSAGSGIGAKVTRLLQAIEIRKDLRRLLRAVWVLDRDQENVLTGSVLRYTPVPGVRNDRSYNPGETLRPILSAGGDNHEPVSSEVVDVTGRLQDRGAV